MEQSEKTSMQAYKRCPQCNEIKPKTDFYKNKTRYDGVSGFCKNCVNKKIKEYRKTDRGKQLTWRTNHSVAGVARRKRYKYSPKGRTTKLHYRNSEKGQETRARWQENYINSGRNASWKKARYYRLQDEFGCHSHIDNFYPAYRFIKALETAKVVEI